MVYIIGSGGHGKVILSVLQANNVNVEGFLDDKKDKVGHTIKGIPIVERFTHLWT